MIVDLEDWKRLTGRDGPEAAPIRKEVSSWGKTITAIGAPSKGAMTIGSARLEAPSVYCLEEQPRMFAGWPFPAKGLVGNAPFWDRVVILDLGIRPRLGLLRNGRAR